MKRLFLLSAIPTLLGLLAMSSPIQSQGLNNSGDRLTNTPAVASSATPTPSPKKGQDQANADGRNSAATNEGTSTRANPALTSNKNASPVVRDGATQTQSGPPPAVMNQDDPAAVQRVAGNGDLSQNEASQDPGKAVVTQDDLGMLSWLTNPIVFGAIAFLIVVALLLHLYHLLKTTQISRDFGELMIMQRRLTQSRQVSGLGDKSQSFDTLTEKLNKQNDSAAQLATRLNHLENRLTIGDGQAADTIKALSLASSWIGHGKMEDSRAADDGQLGEKERAAAIGLLERYIEPLRINSGRVEPLTQALADLIEQIEDRSYQAPELIGRIQKLYQEIGRLDELHTNAGAKLSRLQSKSFSQRSSMLKSEQERLLEQARSGEISASQMVQKSRDVLEQYFPDHASQNGHDDTSAVVSENELNKSIAGAADYVMDWFNSLFQLQNQLASSGTRSALESEIINELVHIQKTAQEVLAKFDVQLETIQVGQTNYDRRLHEATMVRQSSQFPTNTVIDVHRCGFRRISTGEVLRRPEVVVAGAAAT